MSARTYDSDYLYPLFVQAGGAWTVNAGTYFWGRQLAVPSVTNALRRQFKFPSGSWRIVRFEGYSICGTPGNVAATVSELYLRVDDSVDYLITGAFPHSVSANVPVYIDENLDIPIENGQAAEMKLIVPAFATSQPINAAYQGYLHLRSRG